MENKENNRIRIKVMCVITDGDRVLAGHGHDNVKNEDFYRVLDGNMEFGETSEEGVRREIRKELNSEIEDLKFLDVVENTFVYKGKPGHEIIFLFQGTLADKEIYTQAKIHIVEDGYEFDAEWVALKDVLAGTARLYPEYDYSKVFNAGLWIVRSIKNL
ncbi:MAG: NUDIX domain-containing protein [Candidatus Niyogibacteria bacterium]|nr:NUDIX domain-containing protein [Candidatus Niyogibacteria bacterium]